MSGAGRCCARCGGDISHRAPQARFCNPAENPVCRKARQNDRQDRCRSEGLTLPPRGWQLAPGPILREGGGENTVDGHVELRDGWLDTGPREQDATALWLDGDAAAAEAVAEKARNRLLRELDGAPTTADATLLECAANELGSDIGSLAEICRITGTAPHVVLRASRIREADPEIFEQVWRGEFGLAEAESKIRNAGVDLLEAA